MIDRILDTSGPATPIQSNGGERTVHGRVLVASPGTQMRDSLDTNVQGHEVLTDYVLRQPPVLVIQKESRISVLRELENVETHILPPIERPQRRLRH